MFNLNKRLVFFLLFFLISIAVCPAEELDKQMAENIPIIVNGDKVEFFTELKKIIAEGNVKIEYGSATLTCNKITVFTQTKDAFAEGNVKLEDERGTVEGKSAFYNFDAKAGKILEANIKTDPYYCVSAEAEKLPTKFILHNADITTCNLDIPHYHFHARKVTITPGDKLRARGVKFVAGTVPIMYFPYFVQDIAKKRNGMAFNPGMSKEEGSYLLTGYRYHFTDAFKGLFRLDYRENKGFASGIDLESYTHNFGDARLQWYFINETLHGKGEVEPIFKSDYRHKLEYRHKWDINEKNHFIMELNDYSDVNVLKNYFYRQYEKYPTPNSYMLFSHNYPSATLSLLLQKRVNQFFSETERIPEVKLETTSQKIFDTPFYYQNQTGATGFTSRTANTDQDEDAVRLDTYNKLSYPFKFSIFELNPYIATRYTYYSKDKYGDENLFRNVFYSGYSLLTHFYRIFDKKVNSYGLEIDKLRHIITPSLSYSFNHHPTLPSERLTAFDGIDSISKQNSMTLSLENRLETKRGGTTVDFLRFIIDSPYDFKLEGHGGRFGDINFDLEILPNSWLKYWSDAKFDLRRRSFRNANFDVEFSLGDKGKVAAGYRYTAQDPEDNKLITFSFERQLSPKWSFRAYQRFELVTQTLEEHEYTLSRDLHCWEIEYTVNNKKKKGVTFWFVFRCKAFPDLGFDFEKTHQAPKTR